MKRTFTLIVSIIAGIFVCGCYLISAPKIDQSYKKTDLNQNLVDSLDFFINAAYKMNAEYSNDFIVALVRMNVLNVPTSRHFSKIMMEIVLTKNFDHIDEGVIRGKLTGRENDDLSRSFPKGLKERKPIEIIKEENPELNEAFTCTPQIVDANWALYSGTGDVGIIDKFIESSKIKDAPCCFSCIEWSVPSQAIENKDVYDHLITIQESLPEISRPWFSRYIPDLNQVKWMNSRKENDQNKNQ